jgi:hypothetical protein
VKRKTAQFGREKWGQNGRIPLMWPLEREE